MDIVTKAKGLMLTLGASPVMWLMIGLSVVSLTIIVERAWFLLSIRANPAELAAKLAAHLETGDVAGARTVMQASHTVEGAIVAAGLQQAHRGPKAASEAMMGAVAVERLRLERRLAFLGTLGNNAPFVGLFGTVVGIVQAFDRLGATGATTSASSSVMASISEALVATAIGLLVAIPAVAAFNAFQRVIKAKLASAEALTRTLLAYLEGTPRAAEPGSRSTTSPLTLVPARTDRASIA